MLFLGALPKAWAFPEWLELNKRKRIYLGISYRQLNVITPWLTKTPNYGELKY